MWIVGVIVLLAIMNGGLWLLNRRLDALPANALHKETWLKDEELLPVTRE